MRFPVDEDKFVERCLKALGEYDDGDIEWAHAIAAKLNQAYYKGLEDGRKEAAECKKQL